MAIGICCSYMLLLLLFTLCHHNVLADVSSSRSTSHITLTSTITRTTTITPSSLQNSSRTSPSTWSSPTPTTIDGCPINCRYFGPDGYRSAWYRYSITTTITHATVVFITATGNGTSTVRNTTIFSPLPSGYTLPTDLNSAGTKTHVVTWPGYGLNRSTTITYPYPWTGYDNQFSMTGTLYTSTSGSAATCLTVPDRSPITFPLTPYKTPPQYNAQDPASASSSISLASEVAADPSGWLHFLGPEGAVFLSEFIGASFPTEAALNLCLGADSVSPQQAAKTAAFDTVTSHSTEAIGLGHATPAPTPSSGQAASTMSSTSQMIGLPDSETSGILPSSGGASTGALPSNANTDSDNGGSQNTGGTASAVKPDSTSGPPSAQTSGDSHLSSGGSTESPQSANGGQPGGQGVPESGGQAPNTTPSSGALPQPDSPQSLAALPLPSDGSAAPSGQDDNAQPDSQNSGGAAPPPNSGEGLPGNAPAPKTDDSSNADSNLPVSNSQLRGNSAPPAGGSTQGIIQISAIASNTGSRLGSISGSAPGNPEQGQPNLVAGAGPTGQSGATASATPIPISGGPATGLTPTGTASTGNTVPPGDVVLASETLIPAATKAPTQQNQTPAPSVFTLGSQTVTAGGPAVTVHGSQISIVSGASSAVIDGTRTIPLSFAQSGPSAGVGASSQQASTDGKSGASGSAPAISGSSTGQLAPGENTGDGSTTAGNAASDTASGSAGANSASSSTTAPGSGVSGATGSGGQATFTGRGTAKCFDMMVVQGAVVTFLLAWSFL